MWLEGNYHVSERQDEEEGGEMGALTKRYCQSKEHRWLLMLSSVFRVDLIWLDEGRIIEGMEEILLNDIFW